MINIESKYPLLFKVNNPDELKKLSLDQLPQLCDELREYLLQSVSKTSGHLASGLGTVELTVALHYVYNTPFDKLIWDVGHQAYPHKILTGRRDQLKNIRKKNGLHPFPWREESEYDTLSVGHSSTSISAGLGLSIAAEKENKQRRIVSVIGDGAMTAGMAFEALNHAGDLKPNMLVVLNDNDMSISENIGGLSKHLGHILTGELYTNLRRNGKKVLENAPPIWELVRRTEEHFKGMVVPSTLFEELGFNYVGPINGHDVLKLVKTFKMLRRTKGPQFLHIVTKKGKGYAPAEENPIQYHGVPQFNPQDNCLPCKKSTQPTFTQIFSNWILDMAKTDSKLCAITPAMKEGSGLTKFAKEYPDRFFDVAIAEQHAITMACGLAIGGYHPVVAIYSTFLQRGYDQLIHDIAIMRLPVLFAIDRAGIVGADGPTHQGAFDISFMRCIPHLVIMTPSDENETRQMLYTGHCYQGPAAVRYPRGSGMNMPVEKQLTQLPIGKGRVLVNAPQTPALKKVAILNFGTLLPHVLEAAKALNATVSDMRFVKPLDTELITALAKTHDYLVTVEENAIKGGAGSGVIEYLMQEKILIPVLNIGLPDQFIPQGTQQEMHEQFGLDASGILQKIQAYIN